MRTVGRGPDGGEEGPRPTVDDAQPIFLPTKQKNKDFLYVLRNRKSNRQEVKNILKKSLIEKEDKRNKHQKQHSYLLMVRGGMRPCDPWTLESVPELGPLASLVKLEQLIEPLPFGNELVYEDESNQ